MHFEAKAIIDGDAQLTFGLNAGPRAFLESDVSWKSQSLICPKEIPIHLTQRRYLAGMPICHLDLRVLSREASAFWPEGALP